MTESFIGIGCRLDLLAQDVDQRIRDRQEQILRDQLDLAFNLQMSPDGFALGLNKDQALKVQPGKTGRRLDMVE